MQHTHTLSAPHSHRSKSLLVLTFLLAVAFAAGVARPAFAAGQPVSIPFPRLAMWWPNNDTQPASDRARYDWIGLQNADADHIGELRALNPDMIILGSNNARELNYRLTGYNEPLNVELRSASTDWMLTQVGSNLTAAITNSSTSIPVGDTSRFAAGEMVLCDHELMHVESVGSSNLTVTRGQVTPTASHGSGARIASIVSVWPGAVEYDVTSACPKVDVGNGPETWNDWNTRRARGVVAAAPWDGIIIDCFDPLGSMWWINEGYIRNMDRNRDNVADDANAFCTAWNSGLGAYGVEVRAAVDSSKYILTNGRFKDYALNGSIFESYPDPAWSLSTWQEVMVSDSAPRAAYLQFSANTSAPNLSAIEEYGVSTNYQLMRYSLCTALMGDGFFSYERSSSGHGTLGLYWFDEYDNAGAGRGYLGQPTGAATQVGNAYRRDFTGGVALINPSTSAVTVQLGGSFKKIKGAQAPTVNDGSTVTAVTIPAKDGLILLRPAPVVVDTTAPQTTCDAVASFQGPATITLHATDTGGSGVAATYYRIDGAAAVAGTSVSVSSPGGHTLSYWSVDGAGNIELAKSTSFTIVSVTIDTTPPSTTSDAVEAYTDSASITLQASDSGGSGVSATYYVLDGGAQTAGTAVNVSTTGAHTLEFWSTDAAGNVESPHHFANFTISASTPAPPEPAPDPAASSITIGSSASSVRLPNSFILSGDLTPGELNDPCAVDVKKPNTGRWSYSSTRLTYTAAGDWWYRYTPTKRGTYYFRVSFAGDAALLACQSGTVAVSVR